jgi:hypothetical protein
MKARKAAGAHRVEFNPAADRREFERVGLPATAFALDAEGNDLGRVAEIGGGGLMLQPASPYARLSLAAGNRLLVTIVEPGTGNSIVVSVEVRYVRSNTVGLRFL